MFFLALIDFLIQSSLNVKICQLINFLFFWIVFCLFCISLISAGQKFALLLKNELLFVILKNVVYSVTISIFVWLAVTVGFGGVLQINCFYKTKNVLIKQLQWNLFWLKLKAVKAFSNDVHQFSSPTKDCNFQRRTLNLAKHLRRAIL